jgi:hypothetical protein
MKSTSVPWGVMGGAEGAREPSVKSPVKVNTFRAHTTVEAHRRARNTPTAHERPARTAWPQSMCVVRGRGRLELAAVTMHLEPMEHGTVPPHAAGACALLGTASRQNCISVHRRDDRTAPSGRSTVSPDTVLRGAGGWLLVCGDLHILTRGGAAPAAAASDFTRLTKKWRIHEKRRRKIYSSTAKRLKP